MKRVIVYYSLTEKTHAAAVKLAALMNAELVRIGTVKSMPKGRNRGIFYGGMLATFGIRPRITGVPADLADCDEIILGTPVWAGKPAPAVMTLLSDSAVAKKVVAAFILSGSGNAGGCEEKLRATLPALALTVSLVDDCNAASADNESKLLAFAKSLPQR